MYSVIEFKNEADGGGLSIVNTAWLTPRKTEVYWPPIKDNLQFKKVLRKLEPEFNENWQIYGINKKIYATDDFDKAINKLKTAEITSDLQTDPEDHAERPRRRIIKRKFCSDESDSDQQAREHVLLCKKDKKLKQRLPRPPSVKINLSNARGSSQELESGTDESDTGEPFGASGSKLLSNTSTPSNKLFQTFTSTSKASSFGSKGVTTFETPTRNESLNFDKGLQDQNDILQKTPGNNKKFSNTRAETSERSKPNALVNVFLDNSIPSCSSNNQDILETPRTAGAIESCNDRFNCLIARLIKIELQNNQIISILRQKKSEIFGTIPECINELPLKTIEELTNFETKISSEEEFKSLVSYLSQIGGEGTVTRTNKILRFLLKDELAKLFNFCGHNNKQPFASLKLKDAITQSVQSKEKAASKHDIEQCIKNWLKYAPKRIQIARSKEERI